MKNRIKILSMNKWIIQNSCLDYVTPNIDQNESVEVIPNTNPYILYIEPRQAKWSEQDPFPTLTVH